MACCLYFFAIVGVFTAATYVIILVLAALMTLWYVLSHWERAFRLGAGPVVPVDGFGVEQYEDNEPLLWAMGALWALFALYTAYVGGLVVARQRGSAPASAAERKPLLV